LPRRGQGKQGAKDGRRSEKQHLSDMGPSMTASNTKPKISLCMIVKDEEKQLDRCLDSVQECVDEIVIVDTGSTDRTVEIARRYTNKVYVHPWQDSFSEARNHYLRYATGDWIFQIDADEELIRDDIPVLLEAVRHPGIDAVMVQIVSRSRAGKSKAIHNVERIFRNNGTIHYEGRVHNRVVGIATAKVYPIRVLHHGYEWEEVLSKKKFERTVRLLEMDLRDDRENPVTHHYLSCSYLSQGMFAQALEASLTAIRLAEARNERNLLFLWTHYNAAMSQYKLQNLAGAEELAVSALRKFANHVDSHFILALVCFDQKRWREVVSHGEEYLRLIELLRANPADFGNLVTCAVNEAWNVDVLLGIAYFELGLPAKADQVFAEAESRAPEPFVALRAVGIYLHNKKLYDKARLFLEKARRINPGDATIINLLGQGQAGEVHQHRLPTISCCMIVKNEEAFLEQCLESVKGSVDEIVIVDTGSTDGTVEIAKRYTDKVYCHPWEGSFSKARNQALQYATCDWIFQIDGDEELVETSRGQLRQTILDAGRADAVHVNIISSYCGGRRMARHNFERLFKNNGVIHYEGIVHNSVVGATCIKASKIELRHYGYDVDEKKAQEKFLRTTQLLKQQIEADPSNPMPHHYLGTSYLSRGLHEEAARESLRAIQLADEQGNEHPLYLWTRHNASLAAYHLGDLEQAERLSLQALVQCPDHLDSYWMLSMVAAEKGRWQDVARYGERYLELRKNYEENPDRAGLVVNNTLKEEAGICLVVGHAFHALQDCEQATLLYDRAHAASQDKWQAWWNVGTFHLDRSGDLALAQRYLSLALEEAPEEHSVWYMLAKLNNKLADPLKEKECLRRLFALGSEDQTAMNRLASLCLEAGDLAFAERALDRVMRVDPGNYVTLCNLGQTYQRQGRIEAALQAFTKAVELHPHAVDPWVHLSEISDALNRPDDAKFFIDHARSLMQAEVNRTHTIPSQAAG